MSNQASKVKRNSLNKSDIDVKLDKILDTLAEKSADSDSRLRYVDAYELALEVKLEMLDRLNTLLDRLQKLTQSDYYEVDDIALNKAIEAERNKLRESK